MSQKWNSSIAFPRDNFVLRCIEENFSLSKGKENPMITLTYEIDRPEEVNIAGENYMVVGQKVTGYYTTKMLNGEGDLEEKNKNMWERVFVSNNSEKPSLYQAFGLDGSKEDPENPTLGFKGKLVWALLYDDAQPQHKSPTKEELAKGQKQGAVILHPITRKPLISHYPKIAELFGPAEGVANKPF